MNTQLAFENLKAAMTNTPVLVLPDFTKPFLLKTDATGLVWMPFCNKIWSPIKIIKNFKMHQVIWKIACDDNNG